MPSHDLPDFLLGRREKRSDGGFGMNF